MLTWIIAFLPPDMIRWIGRLQFRIPIAGWIIGWFGNKFLASEGIIRYGVGAGLRFDARGGSSGYLFGTTEPHEQIALAKYLQAGFTFYDIGANVGFFSTLAGRLVGKSGSVYAFEPNPVCVEKVKKNAKLNGFDHVKVVQAAVSSTTGITNFKIGHITGASTIVGNQLNDGLCVAVVAIDDFIENEKASGPNLVMIDAEGAEILILEGMHKTILKFRPVIMCEIHWIGDEFKEYFEKNLAGIGYTIKRLDGENWPDGKIRFHAILLPINA
jgi:FkbM family methyltransferase